MKKENFSFSFKTSKSATEVFEMLLDIKQWWFGLYNETITGKSKKINDTFTFKAGDGVHDTTQKLIELEPGKKIVWQITNSNLSFLKEVNEWTDTKIRFDLLKDGDKTKVTFTHEGLVPEIECYDACSSAWNGYLENFKKKLQ